MTEMLNAAVHDGDRVLDARVALRETEVAIQTLLPDQREILRLVCFEELSYTEPAQVLDVPKGTVISCLSRATLKRRCRPTLP